MNDWEAERDPRLEALVAKCDPPPVDRLDVEALRRSIQERARPIVQRRRRTAAWRRWAAPAGGAASLALAASLAFLLFGPPSTPAPPPASPAAAGPEALVTADLTEEEFRALVSGAGESHSLLLVAAGDL